MKVVIMIILFCCPMIVKADSFFTVDRKPNIYSNRTLDLSLYTELLEFIHWDNEIGYSVTPTGGIYNPIRYQLANRLLSKYSKDTLDFISRASYFGYGYSGRTAIEYYMATQELIWNAVSNWNIYWSKTRGDFYNKINIESYKKEILDSIGEFTLEPSFSNSLLNGSYGSVVTYQDTNQVLSNYEVISSGKNEAWIDGNTLFVKMLSSDDIVLRQKVSDVNFRLYEYGVSYQRIIFCNNPRPVELTLNVQPVEEKKIPIHIICKDSSNLLPIKNHYFQIYDVEKQQFITYSNQTIFKTDESGIFRSPFTLPIGHYEIQDFDLGHYFNQKTHFMIDDTTFHEKELMVTHLIQKKVGSVRLYLEREIVGFENGSVIYKKVPFSGKEKLLVLEDIITGTGILKYHKGDEIEILFQNGIFEMDDIYIGKYQWKDQIFEITDSNLQVDLRQVDEYDLTTLLIDGQEKPYAIVLAEDILVDDVILKKGTKLFQSSNLKQSYKLPNGVYEVQTENDRFSFTVDENHHEFTFNFEEKLEMIPMPDTSAKASTDFFIFIFIVGYILYAKKNFI